MQEIEFCLAPGNAREGNGTEEAPFSSVQEVLNAVHALSLRGERTAPVHVYVRGGEYPLDHAIEITAEDQAPICFEAYPGEKPVFTGGRRIRGFCETVVHGRRAWVADVSSLVGNGVYFHQLFVNGQRRRRPRWPKQGFFVMEDVPDINGSIDCWEQFPNGTNRFVYREGDLSDFRNISDVEIIAHHFWVDERMPIQSIDYERRLVTSSTRAVFVLKNDNNRSFASYYAENVFEALTEPGEWYLDRQDKKLYYLPFDEEKIEDCQVVAPVLSQLLKITGNPEEEKYVDNISFVGITFEYADWHHTMPVPKPENEYFGTSGFDRGPMPCATAPQAALHCPGAVEFLGARNCRLDHCVIRHVGFYGVEFRSGCTGCAVKNCEIFDTGAGGIRAGGTIHRELPNLITGINRFENNVIHQGGEVFLSGVGILLVHSAGNRVLHNTIHDYYYTGISSGWVWGFSNNVSRENLIEGNHIYNLGKGLISDMGGVYILGVQAGTIIRGNHIHDIRSCNYGGWGIYLDEGSSFVIVENNLVHHVSNQCFNQHYGRENIIRNNIFAYSADCIVHIQRSNTKTRECPVSSYTNHGATFERNIILSDGKPFHLFDTTPPEDRLFRCVGNTYWNTELKEKSSEQIGESRWRGEKRMLSLSDFEDLNMMACCICQDPLLTLTDNGFFLDPQSPAYKQGFVSFDAAAAGVKR